MERYVYLVTFRDGPELPWAFTDLEHALAAVARSGYHPDDLTMVRVLNNPLDLDGNGDRDIDIAKELARYERKKEG